MESEIALKLMKGFVMTVFMFALLLIGGFLFVRTHYLANEPVDIVEVAEEPTVEQFIDTIGETARRLGQEHDLYASVMIAQAVLESNRGTSQLSQAPYHNLFGIKGSYENQHVTFETLEDDGTGKMSKVMAPFRKYPSYEASLTDYVALLKEGVSWDENFYTATFKSNTASYLDVTAFLTGTYATDTGYAEKLNRLIEQYQLERYDQPL